MTHLFLCSKIVIFIISIMLLMLFKWFQEPGNNEEITKFVSKYGVNFDFFSKVDVNGPKATPLYQVFC